jgi:hypothetical protein
MLLDVFTHFDDALVIHVVQKNDGHLRPQSNSAGVRLTILFNLAESDKMSSDRYDYADTTKILCLTFATGNELGYVDESQASGAGEGGRGVSVTSTVI